MLVLSRQRLEEIVITSGCGETIVLCLVDFREGRARLGFTAPESVRIDRREVHEARQRQQERGVA